MYMDPRPGTSPGNCPLGRHRKLASLATVAPAAPQPHAGTAHAAPQPPSLAATAQRTHPGSGPGWVVRLASVVGVASLVWSGGVGWPDDRWAWRWSRYSVTVVAFGLVLLVRRG